MSVPAPHPTTSPVSVTPGSDPAVERGATARDRWLAGYLALLGVAVAVVSAIGVLGRGDLSVTPFVTVRGEAVDVVAGGVYAWNPERLVAEGIGWDLVTLLLVVPVLLATVRSVARGALRGRLVTFGLLGYLFYQYLMYAMAWAFGPLFLPFVGLYAASLIGLAWLATTIPLDELHRRAAPRFPRRATIGFGVLMALLLLGMWLPMVAEVQAGMLEDNLRGQTTLVVQALDLGLVVPLAVATAVLLVRRRPIGYLLAAFLVVKGAALATAIVAMVLVAWRVEGDLAIAETAVFAAAAFACLALWVAMSRAIGAGPVHREPPAPGDS